MMDGQNRVGVERKHTLSIINSVVVHLFALPGPQTKISNVFAYNFFLIMLLFSGHSSYFFGSL